VSKRRKMMLLSVGVIALLSILLICVVISGVDSLLLMTVITILLHIAACGSILYFCFYKPAPDKRDINCSKKE
jgi:hypothetical protein